MDERFYDATRLREHARALRTLAEDPEPRASLIAGTPPSRGAQLGLLAGSFNPPTIAHTALAEAGLAGGHVDRVHHVLSTRTVDKEVVSGAALEDRLLLLDLLAASDPRLGTLLINRGLYVDQARLARAAFPDLSALIFLVGFDKIVQIFDPRYYDDRDAALEQLFALATFLVAPRGTGDAEALAVLLAHPENRRFAGAVEALDLPRTVRNVASSTVRGSIGGGQAPDQTLPPLVQAFVAATGAYAADERYRRRLDVLATLERVDDDTLSARLRAAAAS